MTKTDAFDITTLVLSKGRHASPAQGVCFLEAVSLLAGDVFSDEPRCVCSVIAAFGRVLNDNMPDHETRTRLLLPYAEKLLGTRAPANVRKKRAFLLADWAVRVIVPQALEKAGLHKQAIKLRNLAPVVDKNTATQAREAAKATAGGANAAAIYADNTVKAARYAAAEAAGYAASTAGYAASTAAPAAHAARCAHAAAGEAAYAARAAAADDDAWTQAAAMLGSLCEVT